MSVLCKIKSPFYVILCSAWDGLYTRWFCASHTQKHLVGRVPLVQLRHRLLAVMAPIIKKQGNHVALRQRAGTSTCVLGVIMLVLATIMWAPAFMSNSSTNGIGAASGSSKTRRFMRIKNEDSTSGATGNLVELGDVLSVEKKGGSRQDGEPAERTVSSPDTGIVKAGIACFGPRVSFHPPKVAVFTCGTVHEVLAYQGSQVWASPRVSLDDIFAPWMDAGFSPVIVSDCFDAERDTDAALRAWSDSHRNTARLITSDELSCFDMRQASAAGIAWAVMVGADDIADVAHPWPIAPALLPLPAGLPAQVPASKPESLMAHDFSITDHFTAAGLARVRAVEAAGETAAEDTCNIATPPTVQLGLCHEADDYKPDGHSTIAANQALASNDGPAMRRLLEHVTPLQLPHGIPAETAFAETPRSIVRMAHRSAAWALLDDRAAIGPGSLSVVVQAILQIAGHSALVLPPGRICNISVMPAQPKHGHASPTGALEATRAALSSAQQLMLPASDYPLRGHPAVSIGLMAYALLSRAAGLDGAQAAVLESWMFRIKAAYSASQRGEDVDGAFDGVDPTHILPRASAEPPPPHCWVDHANVRDIVLAVNFNNWLNTSAATLQTLRRLYGPHFPLIVAFGGDSTLQNDVPELNAWRCASDWGRENDWPGGIVSERCGADLMRRYPGHLGYVIMQDDVLWMPWNTLAYDPHRIWALNHTNDAPGVHEDRSTWFYECDRTKNNDTHPWCYGCYTWHPQIGGTTVAKLHNNLTSKQLSIKSANTGREDGVSCDLTDGLYVPGRLGREFGRLSDLFASANTEVEMAYTTIMDSMALRREQQPLRHVNAWARKTLDDLMQAYRHTSTDALSVLDWIHPFKLSNSDVRAFVEAEFARAARLRLATAPDLAALQKRPNVNVGHL